MLQRIVEKERERTSWNMARTATQNRVGEPACLCQTNKQIESRSFRPMAFRLDLSRFVQ